MARAAKKAPMTTPEQWLREAVDVLRGNQEPSVYKHVVLGLVFLKNISGRFEERRAQVDASLSHPNSGHYIPEESGRAQLLEDPDECTSRNVYGVPEQAPSPATHDRAKRPSIGQRIDHAMDLIEKENPQHPECFAAQLRPRRTRQGRLGQLLLQQAELPAASGRRS